MFKDDCKYKDSRIIVTGHSLGGSLAQIVAALKNTHAVTFNAYGTKNLFKETNNLMTDKIINYFNPRDKVVKRNFINNLGTCYIVDADDSFFDHSLEEVHSLRTRILVSPEDLQNGSAKKMLENHDNYYKTHGRHKPIVMGSIYAIGDSDCSGEYPVSGYTRKDGTKVSLSHMGYGFE